MVDSSSIEFADPAVVEKLLGMFESVRKRTDSRRRALRALAHCAVECFRQDGNLRIDGRDLFSARKIAFDGFGLSKAGESGVVTSTLKRLEELGVISVVWDGKGFAKEVNILNPDAFMVDGCRALFQERIMLVFDRNHAEEVLASLPGRPGARVEVLEVLDRCVDRGGRDIDGSVWLEVASDVMQPYGCKEKTRAAKALKVMRKHGIVERLVVSRGPSIDGVLVAEDYVDQRKTFVKSAEVEEPEPEVASEVEPDPVSEPVPVEVVVDDRAASQLMALRGEIDSLYEEVLVRKRGEVEDAEAKLAAAVAEFGSVRDSIDMGREGLEVLQTQIAGVTDLLDEKQKSLSCLGEQIADAEAKIITLRGQIEDLEGQKSTYEELQARLTECDSQIEEKRSILEDLESTISERRGEVESFEQQIAGFQQTCRILQDEIAVFNEKKATYEGLLVSIDKARGTLAELEGSVSEQQGELTSVEDRLAFRRAEAESAQERYDGLLSQIQEAQIRLQDLIAEIEAKKTEPGTESFEEQQALMEALRQQIEDLSSQLETQRERNAAMQSDITSLEVEKSRLFVENKTLASEKAALEANLEVSVDPSLIRDLDNREKALKVREAAVARREAVLARRESELVLRERQLASGRGASRGGRGNERGSSRDQRIMTQLGIEREQYDYLKRNRVDLTPYYIPDDKQSEADNANCGNWVGSNFTLLKVPSSSPLYQQLIRAFEGKVKGTGWPDGYIPVLLIKRGSLSRAKVKESLLAKKG